MPKVPKKNCINISALKKMFLIGLFDYKFLNAFNFTKMERKEYFINACNKQLQSKWHFKTSAYFRFNHTKANFFRLPPRKNNLLQYTFSILKSVKFSNFIHISKTTLSQKLMKIFYHPSERFFRTRTNINCASVATVNNDSSARK